MRSIAAMSVLFVLAALSARVDCAENDLPVLIVKLSAPEAPVREAAAKEIMTQFKETIAAAKRPYIKTQAADIEGEDAAKKEKSVKLLGDAFNNLRKAATQQQVDALKQIASGKDDEKKKGLEFFVENINNLLERDMVYGEIENLASADPKVVHAAHLKLVELGGEAAPYIASSLDDERPVVKRACVEILKTMGPAAKTAANDLQFLLDSDDKSARRMAASLLEGLGPDAVEVVDDLVMYLEHDEKSVRRSAATILKKIGPAAKEAAGDLADLLDNEDKHVRQMATEVLVGMGPEAKGAVETLTSTLDDAANDADTRERAASILSSIGPEAKAAVETLKKHEKDPDPGVKAAVEAALKTIQK